MILLLMRFAYAICVAVNAVGSYPAFSPLPVEQAVIFCSTFCRNKELCQLKGNLYLDNFLLPPGDYPASFPKEPGLSLPPRNCHKHPASGHASLFSNYSSKSMVFSSMEPLPSDSKKSGLSVSSSPARLPATSVGIYDSSFSSASS